MVHWGMFHYFKDICVFLLQLIFCEDIFSNSASLFEEVSHFDHFLLQFSIGNKCMEFLWTCMKSSKFPLKFQSMATKTLTRPLIVDVSNNSNIGLLLTEVILNKHQNLLLQWLLNTLHI